MRGVNAVVALPVTLPASHPWRSSDTPNLGREARDTTTFAPAVVLGIQETLT